MLVEAAAQVAPVVSQARTLDRFIAPVQERLWSLARNLWWSWDHDSRQLVPRSGSRPLERAESQPDCPARRNVSREDRKPRRRTRVARPDQLRISPPVRVPAGGPDLGRQYMPARCVPGRWPTSRPSSDLHESIPIYSGGLGRACRRPHQERVGSGYSVGRHRIVLWPGILPPAAGCERLAARGIFADRRESFADGTGHRHGRPSRYRTDRDSQWLDPRESLAA